MSERLPGARKAAIALLSLPEDVAADVLARLSEPEVRRLRQEVDALGEVADDIAAAVLDELALSVVSPLAMARTAGPAYLLRLAQRAFGDERAGQLFAAPSPPRPEAADRLRGARVADLAALLADEHPQISAIVLTQLPSALAAKVLSAMSSEPAAEVLARLATVEEIPRHALAEASQALARALEGASALDAEDSHAAFDGLSFAAAIARELDSSRTSSLLEQVSAHDRRTAARLRTAVQELDRMAVPGAVSSAAAVGVAATAPAVAPATAVVAPAAATAVVAPAAAHRDAS